MQRFLNSAIIAGQFESSVSASNPVINQGELKQIIQNWSSKQGKHWPSDLDADALTNNLRLIHLPYWVGLITFFPGFRAVSDKQRTII